MMMLDSFAGLLTAARQQPEGQRLLMVFVRKVLHEGANPAQQARFAAGLGGALVPVLYVDKGVTEVADFAALVAEAEHTGRLLGKGEPDDWDMVIVGCLGGYGAREPTSTEAEVALNNLLRTIRTGGSLMHLAAFDRDGDPVRFQ